MRLPGVHVRGALLHSSALAQGARGQQRSCVSAPLYTMLHPGSVAQLVGSPMWCFACVCLLCGGGGGWV